MHKAQVTIFIAIGLLLVIIAGAVLFMVNEPEVKTPAELAPIKTYVESCLETTIEEAAEYVAFKGGYYRVPKEFVEIEYSIIPYYYLNENLAPDIARVENSIEEYVNDLLAECLDELPGYELEPGEAKTDIKINEQDISAILSMPIKVYYGDSVSIIKDFTSEVESSLFHLYTQAVEAADNVDKTGMVCISCLDRADLYHINSSTMVIMIKGQEIIYRIAVQGTIEQEEWDIVPIDSIQAYVGYEFEHQMEINGDAVVVFSDTSGLFDITEKGLISFVPDTPGKHLVVVKAQAGDIVKTELFTINVTAINTLPRIDYIGYHTAFIGEKFDLTVNANMEVTFVDDTELFDIGVYDGKISFTPTTAGEYTFNITAISSDGGYSIEQLNLVIVE